MVKIYGVMVIVMVTFIAGNTPAAGGEQNEGRTPEIVWLWPGQIPGEVTDKPEAPMPETDDGFIRLTNVSRPSLTLFKAEGADGPAPAVVICPGGGYEILAFNYEGTDVAQWLNTLGVSAVVLKYRVPGNRAGAFQDVQRALRVVRQHAGEWNIDPARVGVLGFSAGGHLSVRASTGYAEEIYTPMDEADALSGRPDFTILVYPAYLSEEGVTLAPEIVVTEKTPPAFIVQAQDDTPYVPSAMAYYRALWKAGVPSELHLFPRGGHGYGMRLSPHAVSCWPDLCAEWMKGEGVIADGDNR